MSSPVPGAPAEVRGRLQIGNPPVHLHPTCSCTPRDRTEQLLTHISPPRRNVKPGSGGTRRSPRSAPGNRRDSSRGPGGHPPEISRSAHASLHGHPPEVSGAARGKSPEPPARNL